MTDGATDQPMTGDIAPAADLTVVTDADRQRYRSFAEHAIKRLDYAYQATTDQLSGASKWLLATLVTINGGGALATINLLPRVAEPGWPAGLFTAGILLTVLSGVVIQHVAEAAINAMEPISTFWLDVVRTGEVDQDALVASRHSYSKVHRFGLMAPALGWVAGVCFFAGLISLAHQASIGDPDNNQRCLALQRDMMAAEPRRNDSSVLFQAFGCRPQGAGNVMVRRRRSDV